MKIYHFKFAAFYMTLAMTLAGAESLPELNDIKIEHFKKSVPWGVARIHAPKAWKKTKGSAGVCVVGEEGRGTAAAGVIASVAPEAKLSSVKTVERNNSVSRDSLVKGILWCVDQGRSRIVNLSLWSHEMELNQDSSKILEQAIAYAHAKGVLVVVGAGAGSVGPQAITVTASNPEDSFCGGASGPEVDFIAPGKDVLTTIPGGGYGALSGADIAAAHVSGLAALYISLNPKDSADEVRNALKRAAAPIKKLPVEQQGYGMIDAAKLVELSSKGE